MTKFLDQIVGNDKIKIILSNILSSGNIPHAFLFVGSDGVGKENTAIALAKSLNQISSTPEVNQKIAHAIESFSEPYIKYILPLPRGKNENDQNDPYEKLSADEIEIINLEFEKKSQNLFYKIVIPRTNQIKISSIRDIKKFLSLNYDDVKFRVILISQAHLMNEESQNALLKNLEEPPDGVIFILCTSAPERLRETIRSRCWKIMFQPLNEKQIKNILVTKFDIDETTSEEVSYFSSGSIQQAIELIENNFEELKEKTIRILRFSFGRKYHSAFTEFEDAISDSDQLKLKLLIRLVLIWLNDFQKLKSNLSNDSIFFSKHIETLEKFYAKFPQVELARVTNNLDKISSSFKNNINLNVAVSNIVFELSQLTIS